MPETNNRIYATGKRKTAVARVWLSPGSGQISVNGRTSDEYFVRETNRMIMRQSLELLELIDQYDVQATVVGGGHSAQAEAMLLAWDPTPGWQLRLRARLTVETDGLEVSSRWARLKMHPAAQDYLSPLPPGQPLAGPTPPDRGTRSHFAVVTAQVEGFDWLELHRDGHRRACFDAAGQGQWLSP